MPGTEMTETMPIAAKFEVNCSSTVLTIRGLWWLQVGIADEGFQAPISHDCTKDEQGNGDGYAKTHSPGVVEADVAHSTEAVIQSDEKESDINGNEPRVAKKTLLYNFERKTRRRAHLGCKMRDPKVHHQQYEQGGAGDPLQIPVDRSSRHELLLRLDHSNSQQLRRSISIINHHTLLNIATKPYVIISGSQCGVVPLPFPRLCEKISLIMSEDAVNEHGYRTSKKQDGAGANGEVPKPLSLTGHLHAQVKEREANPIKGMEDNGPK